MECPLYQNERYCLFRNLRETNKNIETLLFENDENSINENSNIFNKVRAYIRQTKRYISRFGIMDIPLDNELNLHTVHHIDIWGHL
jgi:hypothetical protein